MTSVSLHEEVTPTSIVNLDVLQQRVAAMRMLNDPVTGRSASVEELCSAWEALQKHRRREALIVFPLWSGMELSWAGPSMFQSVSPHVGVPDPPATSAEERQPVQGPRHRPCSPLLVRSEEGQVGPPEGTTIALLGPLGIPPFDRKHYKHSCEGINYEGFTKNTMQVWLGEVFSQGKPTGTKVALKLYDERVLSYYMNRNAFQNGSIRYAGGMEDVTR